MISQAEDFRAESMRLYTLLKGQPETILSTPTLFKGWTINDILQHLHFWNHAAYLSSEDEAAFMQVMGELLQGGMSMRAFEDKTLGGLSGTALLEAWHDSFMQLADLFAALDPKKRLKWAGPDMSALSSITARLMETWAHGQAVYDVLGVEREDQDYIRNIAHLGINTFGWTYKVNGKQIPSERPYVCLTAPSGTLWEWGDPSQSDKISGPATDFCQVVTQTRNIEDTALSTVGDIATEWMQIAQCFAGPPETPPAVGARHINKIRN
ncbi:TIGR03084 family protein [Kordiimonas sediminis]|uniref:TIGR03084 family protein n=1 Tax=Kordiimonas sediminis TaxID=1735581 RepID=A0A919AYK2_9PROT|nr:TIGR03084 family metal-binding protein [Kordiimonas sediminis]GHF31194.1 TIGR03084 family protein [Kordiimonas sediminis]